MKKREYVEYDPDADALYVGLQDADVARTARLDDLRMIDYAQDGSIVGIEFIDVSAGVDLSELGPLRARVDELIGRSGFKGKLLA